MYTVLGFSLFFHQEDNPTINDLYESLQEDLKNALLIPTDSHESGWPNGEWRLDQYTAIRSEEWAEAKSSNGLGKRLLKVQLEKSLEDYNWTVDLCLGRIREDDVVFCGKWQMSSYKVTVPIEELPNLDAFHSYWCKNQDGLFAGKTYVVSKERVKHFVEFLRSSERRLPVVLVSCLRDDSQYLLPDIGGLACKVRGLAHVIKLEDDRAAQDFRLLLPNHGCYNGAVRVFWPGFDPENDPLLYPFWHPNRVRAVDEAVHVAILERLVEQSPRILIENPDIEHLEQQQLAEGNRERLDVLRKQIDDLESKRVEWDEFFEIYDQVEQERNELRDENSGLKHKVRSLEWHLNNARMGIQQLEEADREQPTDVYEVYLSSKAHRKYSSFTADERDYWDEHLLGKLLNEQIRSNQSEPLPGRSGTCWVYPRSRTADGRRLIYYTIEQQIYVCEIFGKDEHDAEYTQLRNEGVDRQVYEDFEDWRTDAA